MEGCLRASAALQEGKLPCNEKHPKTFAVANAARPHAFDLCLSAVAAGSCFLRQAPRLSLLRSPVALVALQDLTLDTHTNTHTHGFDNSNQREWGARDTVKAKHSGSLLPVSLTTEP